MASELETVRKPGDIAVVRITAEQMSDVSSLCGSLIEVDANREPKGYVINLAGIRLLPSELLSAFVVLHRHAPHNVKLCHVDPNIVEMLTRTQLTRLFEICTDEGVALDRI